MAGSIANQTGQGFYGYEFNESGPAREGFVSGTIGFVKDSIQGMCSGAMTFVGILTTIGADISALPSLPLESFVKSGLEMMQLGEFSMSNYAGPTMIAIGAGLFFTARRGMARTLGLIGVILYITAYAAGIDLSPYVSELQKILGPLLQQAEGIAIAFSSFITT